jgi:hypothetical protein
MSPLQEQIRVRAPWLFDTLGCSVIEDSYDSKAFGDSVVVLQCEKVKIRFLQDRGQIFVELMPPAEAGKWWDLFFLLEAIHGLVPNSSFDLDDVTSLLRNELVNLIDALGPKWSQTQHELQRRRQERLEALRNQPSDWER